MTTLLLVACSLALTLARPGEPQPTPAPAQAPAPHAKTPPADAKPASKPTTPAAPAPPAATPPPGGNPTDIMNDVEKARPKEGVPPSPATMSPAPGKGAKGDSAEARTSNGRLLREGSFIANRKGRMIRSSSGDWAMTFDADANGPADAPMILMPCLNLMAMEKIAERASDGLTFSVSGQVFVYKSKNYLLPTMYVINRASDLVGGR